MASGPLVVRLSRLNVGVGSDGHIGTLSLQDVSSSYCRGTVIYTSSNGTISDHTARGNYLNNMNCSWILAPANPNINSITLTFSRFSTEFGYDFLQSFAGASNLRANIVDDMSGGPWPPKPVVVWDSAVFLQFTTDGDGTKPGFSIDYVAGERTRPPPAPDDCSAVRGTPTPTERPAATANATAAMPPD